MVKIGFAGDFCPWKRIETLYQEGDWEAAFSGVRKVLKENALNVIDLEGPLTTGGKPIVKTGPHLKAHPATAAILPWLNCHLAATANNHFMDYGEEGMRQTYRALEQAKVQWVGSGADLATATQPYRVELDGIKFAFLNMAENEWTTTQGDAPGCNPLDLVYAQQAIASCREEVDFVIVILHGGHEHYALPSPRMKKEYRYMIDIGADAVVGHHPHIVSGYETYCGKPIFYSLGNFCFDMEGYRNHAWNIGMLLHLSFTKGSAPSFTYDFVRQNDTQPGLDLLRGEEWQAAHARLHTLNAVIQDDANLAEQFSAYCEKLTQITLARLEPYANRYLVALYNRQLLPGLMGSQKRKLLTNLVRCESHREVLLAVLQAQELD